MARIWCFLKKKLLSVGFSSYDGDLSLPLGLALGSPIFPSGCEGKLGPQKYNHRLYKLKKADLGDSREEGKVQ